ncbi:nitrogen-specific signal transduction histidine kinase NtrB [Salinisphaera sp. PC39]|uniref:nitrogen regulation protein NR(II) n=1 Tax=Salinisphaera sp. PC39 TaxID=1304156 RepID=UPI0033420C6D
MNRRPPQNGVRPDTVLDNMTTAVVCLDRDLCVGYINPASEILFGVSARHCRGERLDKVLPHLAGQQRHFQQALADGAAYTKRELKLKHSGGEPITVDCSATPFTNRNGDPALLLELLSLDRQLRISREDQMRAQNLANREMLRGLAHEIKNPLGGLRGAAQLLAREFADPAAHEYTDIIIREADRLQNLVDGMLGPRRPPQKAPLNIHEALEHVRQLLEADLPQGVHLLRDYDPSLPEIRADREQMIQVFFNLVGNAGQAVDGSGHVTLCTRSQRLFTIGGRQHRLVIRVDVIDDGPGIPEELLPKIFHPMVTSRADGTGMGLPIAQYLVHLHGGLIECDSKPGETRFSVFLPLDGGESEESDNG